MTDQEFLDAIKRDQLNRDILNEFAKYNNTGDARFLWRALLRLHGAGEPIPQNLYDKLAEWADKAIAAEDPREIARALELVGDGKRKIGPKHSAAYVKRWRLASEVQIVMDLYKIKLVEAIATVARNRGESASKVKKAYHDVLTAPVSAQNQRLTGGVDLASAIGISQVRRAASKAWRGGRRVIRRT